MMWVNVSVLFHRPGIRSGPVKRNIHDARHGTAQISVQRRTTEPARFQRRDSGTESMMSTELFVEGVAIMARVFRPLESSPLSPLLKNINDVLGEVVGLIERLEADRQSTEEALHKEKRRKRFLESKVERVSLGKQQEHSSVVQKEHEACNRDISELKWQLKLEKEKLDKLQEKLSDTEVLNRHLHEDINFAQKQTPIVKENLDLQRTAINQINAAQAKADEVDSKTQSDLLMVQEEFKKMEREANNEKISLDHMVLTMETQLANTLEDLNQMMTLEKSLCAEIDVAERTVALTEDKCAAMKQRIPEMMELEKTEEDLISQLKCQIEDERQKNKKLKEKVTALQEDIERSKLNGEEEVSCIEEQFHSKRNALTALCKENMECEQNVDDYKRSISESEEAVKQLRSQREQMLQKTLDNDERWEKAKEELTRVVARHSVTKTKLEEQERLTFVGEQRARTEIENLKEDLTGRITVLELLQGQCADVREALQRQTRSSELTNQKLLNDLQEASSTTKALETKVEKIKKVTEHFEKIQYEHRNTLLDLEREKRLRDLHSATVKRCEDTQGRISDLTKKSEEHQDSSDELGKIVASVPEVIEELQSVFDAVDFKNKSAALIMSTLQSDINNCQRQTQRSMQTHSAHVTARRREMEETKEALKTALEENRQLASEYEGLKKILMEARHEEVSALSNKNHEHRSLHYYTQLSLLQKRMHKALVEYFKQRSLYSQAELDRCQALSQETNQKIKTAQEGLSGEIQLIAAFLKSLTDDSTTTGDAGVNKQAGPDAARSNE
ncbi:unnamed protein product [Pleuronectes platessa]|uniref:Uncharacterized protein n=1 Tax=Pleuronectes platessa TaxID=8262 RepID=A0A9N7VHP8_PLEPL|nr:unnamed protein product [Pleuronectes platessa]